MTFPSRHKHDSTQSPGLLFIKTYNLWHGMIKSALLACGITHPQFVFLACAGYLLQENVHVTQNMIAKLSDSDVMTVSQLAVLLEKKGLIDRRPHPEDSRAKSITLTPAGAKMLRKTLPVVERIDEQFFGKLQKDETSFMRMLHTLLQ